MQTQNQTCVHMVYAVKKTQTVASVLLNYNGPGFFHSASQHRPKLHRHIFCLFVGEKQGLNSTTRVSFDGEHSKVLLSEANQMEANQIKMTQNLLVSFP